MVARTSPDTLSRNVMTNVRRMRRARGWLLQQLADALTAEGWKTSANLLSRSETGAKRALITVDELYAYARVFGVTVGDLVADAPRCEHCDGEPPAGFVCATCGATSAP